MKTFLKLICMTAIVVILSSNKSSNYFSVQDFFSKNGAPKQSYTVNATNEGSFTTPEGAVVKL